MRMKQAKSRRWVIIVAGLLILVGVLAFAVPLVVQQMNYATASREADELANTMNLPQEDAYQMVDYSQMPQGETPTYDMSEMQDAGNATRMLKRRMVGVAIHNTQGRAEVAALIDRALAADAARRASDADEGGEA